MALAVGMGLLAALGIWRVEQFMTVEAPPQPATLPSNLQTGPLEGCRRGRLDFTRAPAQSFVEEAAVFNAVLIDRFFGGAGFHPSPRGFPSALHILRRAADPWLRDRSLSPSAASQSMNAACLQFPELDLSTVRSFRYVNRRPGPLAQWFNAPVPVHFVFSIPARTEWKTFFEANSGAHGVTALSRVGFSDDYSQALVYLEHFCGDGCGNGFLLLLHRVGGQWRVTGRNSSWVI
jgi:hypothetical protein